MMLDQIAATASQAVACLVLFLSTCTLTAYIVVSTSRRSILRFGALPALGYLCHLLLHGLGRLSNSIILGSVFIGNTAVVLLQCINFLIVKGYDEQDLTQAGIYKATDGIVVKAWRAVVLLLNLRGTDTLWQDRNRHEFPAYCVAKTANARRDGKTKVRIDRGRYILRQLLVFAWQYLFADVAYSVGLEGDPEMDEKMFGVGSEFAYKSATPEQWTAKLAVGVVGGFGPGRLSIDMWYRLLAVVFVVSGVTDAEYWPPLFGSVTEAYTLRRVWSRFWHQFTRWPLSSISNFIARDVLCLKRSTHVERIVNTLLAFLCSGALHLVIDLYLGISLAESTAIIFFTASAVGIIIEDLALMLWRRLTSSTGTGHTRKWQKAVGFAWVVFWLMITTPWYVFPQARTPPEMRRPVPVGVCEYIGLPLAQGLLVAAGVGIKFYLGGEI